MWEHRGANLMHNRMENRGTKFKEGPSGEGSGTPLQYSCLENPMDRGAWWAAIHGVAKTSLSCIGEGNGNPLQCSCLENPRDGGAWWAAVYGVAQSQTRLKQLSSSSSSKQVETSKHHSHPTTSLGEGWGLHFPGSLPMEHKMSYGEWSESHWLTLSLWLILNPEDMDLIPIH